jgi:transcriptional regulator with XRE-family HTH domain
MGLSYNDRVSAEVRAELGRQQLTQGQLAIRLHWSRMMLHRRLSGVTPWSTDDLEQIARVLGRPVSELVTPAAQT